MGWLWLVGSLKLYVSFAKEPYKRDLNSAKETYNLKELTNRSHPIVTFCVRKRLSRQNKPGFIHVQQLIRVVLLYLYEIFNVCMKFCMESWNTCEISEARLKIRVALWVWKRVWKSICVYVSVKWCVVVCMYVSMSVCMYARETRMKSCFHTSCFLWVCVWCACMFMLVYMYICVYIDIHVYACICICMYLVMHVWMHVCWIYVRM